MKTKEFIKLLQEEDPSGEGYLRFGGSPIFFVASKPGYWDGPYNYLEKGEDGKFTWVESTEGYKVDVYTMDLFDFAERFQGNWEEMEKHIRVEYTYLDDDERKNSFLKLAKKECIEYKEMKDRFFQASLVEMTENAKKGWKWYQNKKVDKPKKGKPNLHKYYTWKVYDENGKEQGSNIHHTECVMKSGDWERVNNKKKRGYYEWVYKN